MASRAFFTQAGDPAWRPANSPSSGVVVAIHPVGNATPGHESSGPQADALHGLLSDALSALAVYDDENSRQCAHHLKLALRAHLQRNGAPAARPPRPRSGLSKVQATAALALIMERLDSNITTQELSNACRLSRGHFSRAFKLTFGSTPHRFLVARRIELACQLLSESQDALADVALRCGFNDQPHFTRVFKSMTGLTPHAWRLAACQGEAGRLFPVHADATRLHSSIV
ncbi:AraC-like DNA-binding protein [Luteibacter rhizovicinus]|uniref:AraC-like DNA-binding protein n=1 Tax=Luteibacter rhizovicinus TaxID=242606 RepID=A0A4R3YLH7_9GAMM|nr:AraC family transcriptional regulator [Luteibacter rhizovicinus]TCV93437.1 AraC-like DNA-binding protein [Luteibacter rhizovicinus]